jgi:hypothetical protein
MIKLKTLSAIAILATAIVSPVFAQDAGTFDPAHRGRTYDQRNFRGAYNQQSGSFYAAPRTESGRNVEDFGYGRDQSRPGGEDPSMNPPAN